ncbi:MAG: helix-turn-helix domain-containing protein, partial [Thermomicrobiales bacterium]
MNEQRALDESSDQSAAPGAFPVSGVRSASEAAAELGINERTIRRAIARGALPAAKRAGSWQIDASDLARFQAANLNANRSPARRAMARGEARRSGPKVVALPLPPPLPVLPVPLTPLIGREREVAEVHALARDSGVRLLT